MPVLIPDQSGDVTFTIPAYDEDGDVLTLSSYTVLTINGVPQGSNPAWIEASGVITTSGEEEPDGRYRLDVIFDFNKDDVAVGVYVIQMVVTDGVTSTTTAFNLDVQATAYTPVPTDVSGLVGWFGAEFEIGFSNGEAVDVLANQVEGLPDLIQPVTDNKPSFVVNDAELNDYASIQFDGSNDLMYFNYDTLSTTVTIFAVAALDAGTASGDRLIFGWLSLFDDEYGKLSFEADGEDLRIDYHDENGFSTDTNINLGELLVRSAGMHIYAGVFEDENVGGYHKFFRDGVVRMYWYEGDSLSGLMNRTVRAVHFGTGLKGRISEMLVYNRALTSLERQKVEIYLANKFNMPIGPNPNYSPTDTTGLFAWYEADQITAGYLTGSLINTWPDSSGNSRNLTSTGAARPTKLTGTAAGKSTVLFEGAQYMQSAVFSPVVPDTSTIFVVAKGDNLTTNTYTIIDGRQNGFRQRLTLLEPQTITMNQGTADVSGSRDTSDYSVICMSMGTTDNLWKNDAVIATGTAGADTLDGITIGSRYSLDTDFLVGEIAEILVFNRQLTDGEIISMNNYLAWKYGVDFSYRSPNP